MEIQTFKLEMNMREKYGIRHLNDTLTAVCAPNEQFLTKKFRAASQIIRIRPEWQRT